MRHLTVTTIRNLISRAIVCLTVAIIFGCQAGGDSGDGTNNPPVISSNTCPTEVYENTQGSCQINASDPDGDPITYSLEGSWDSISIDSDKGVVYWTAPEVDADLTYAITINACDDKAECDSKELQITVLNIEGPITGGNVLISWAANREAAVNTTGGGYKVYYNTTSGFDIGSATEIDVTYESGLFAPTSVVIEMNSGTYYFRIIAYSSINPTGSEPTDEAVLEVP